MEIEFLKPNPSVRGAPLQTASSEKPQQTEKIQETRKEEDKVMVASLCARQAGFNNSKQTKRRIKTPRTNELIDKLLTGYRNCEFK